MNNRVLFVHDGPIGIYNDKAYGTSYNDDLVERYAFFGKSVTFLMRVKPLDQKDLGKYSRIDHPSFNLVSIPNFKSIRSIYNIKRVEEIIYNTVKHHDVIILRFPSAAAVIAYKTAKRLKKPILIEFVACVYDALWNYDWRGKLLANQKLKQYQNLMKKTSHSIYVTNDFLQKRYPTTGKFIGCSDVEIKGIDQEVLSVRLKRIENNSSLNLGTVAAVDVAYKGQSDVIKAIAILKRRKIYFKYTIIGQGNPSRLQKLIDQLDLNDLVRIKGAVPHDQIFNNLKEIDLYVQPSWVEGLPRAVVEAMSMACPVIGTDVGGIPELISKECIYPKGNIQALVALLERTNQEYLELNAKFNFEKAKKYQKEILEKKRKEFFKVFAQDYNLN